MKVGIGTIHLGEEMRWIAFGSEGNYPAYLKSIQEFVFLIEPSAQWVRIRGYP